MKKLWCVAIFLLCFVALQFWQMDTEAQTASTTNEPDGIQYQIGDTPVATDMPRVGMNMAEWTTYGAQQYMNNILQNPGFEAQVDRALVIVSASTDSSFSDTSQYGSFGDGYWDDATFDVRTGQSAGFQGKVTSYVQSGANNNPQFNYDNKAFPGLQLAQNDIIIVGRTLNPNPVNNWWIQADSAPNVVVDPNNARPGSAGTQSMMMTSGPNTPAVLFSYLDSSSNDAQQKFINVTGPWTLSFWAKSEAPDTIFQYGFARLNGTAPFIADTVTLTNDWKFYSFDFTGDDAGHPQTLQLRLAAVATQDGTKSWLDDVYLGPASPTSSWNKSTVDMLKKMNISVLRDWQGQLCDTYENRVVTAEGRKCYSYRAGGNTVPTFGYSIPDLFDLCKQIHANPWVVIPTASSDSDLTQLGQFLSQNATRDIFPEIYLEFGNENWNWIYRECGIPPPYYESHGKASDRAFRLISQAAGSNVNLKKVINGQFASTGVSMGYVQNSTEADILGLAPYFFYMLNAGTPNDQTLAAEYTSELASYQEYIDLLKPYNKQLAFYEINLSTTQGNAQNVDRDPVVAGACGGVALAERLLDGYSVGVKPMNVYSFSQSASGTWEVPGYVLLWGVTQNLDLGRFRPTGLAVNLLNKVAGGAVYLASPTSEGTTATANIKMIAFQDGDTWKAAAVSANNTPQQIRLQFPSDGKTTPTKLYYLKSNSIFDMNEHAENVTVAEEAVAVDEQNQLSFTIPAWGLVVLDADGTTSPTSSTSSSTLTLAPMPQPSPSPTPIPEPAPASRASSSSSQSSSRSSSSSSSQGSFQSSSTQRSSLLSVDEEASVGPKTTFNTTVTREQNGTKVTTTTRETVTTDEKGNKTTTRSSMTSYGYTNQDLR